MGTGFFVFSAVSHHVGMCETVYNSKLVRLAVEMSAWLKQNQCKIKYTYSM